MTWGKLLPAVLVGMVSQAVAWPIVSDDGTRLNVTTEQGTGPLMRYRYGDVAYKPYVEALCTPNGVNVLLDAPKDHIHHHGLMFAIKVNGINFWEEYENPGRQVHQRIVSTTDPEGKGSWIQQQVRWMAPKTNDTFLNEKRTVAVESRAGATLLTWVSQFTLPEGREQATLGGSHYHGLGFRFIRAMDEHGRFRYGAEAARENVRGDEYLTPAPWCAYTAEADGGPVTVAMFDAPGNPRPVLWFTMAKPFAYLSATINLWREPHEMTAGETLSFRYGVGLWDGDVSSRKIEALYQEWKANAAR